MTSKLVPAVAAAFLAALAMPHTAEPVHAESLVTNPPSCTTTPLDEGCSFSCLKNDQLVISAYGLTGGVNASCGGRGGQCLVEEGNGFECDRITQPTLRADNFGWCGKTIAEAEAAVPNPYITVTCGAGPPAL